MAVAERDVHLPVGAGVRVALGHAGAPAALDPHEVRARPHRRGAWLPHPGAGRTDCETGVKVGICWLFIVYLIHTLAELCLSPVGLSAMTKLAPARIVSLMMGVWFLGASIGNFLGGQAASFYGSMPLPTAWRVAFADDRRLRDAAVQKAADAPGRRLIISLARAELPVSLAMALEEYQRKRDFTKSPEPVGDEQQGRASARPAAILLRPEASREPPAL